MGLECSFVWRCPNGAKSPFGHLFVGQAYEDVDAACAAGCVAGVAPQSHCDRRQ